MAVHTLSLFSGIGGLETGAAIVLEDIVPVCYVERELSVARILAQRMEDGALPAAPIWSDIATFRAEGLRGLVDLITAGFPCPDYSLAGKRAGRFGKHGQVWEEVVRIVREVEPRLVFLENVPGILAPHPAGGRPGWIHPPGVWYVLGDLAESGYDAEWLCLRASDVGAPHRRDRWFCLAWRQRMDHSDAGRCKQHRPDKRGAEIAGQGCVPMADADGDGIPILECGSAWRAHTGRSGQGIPDSDCPGREGGEFPTLYEAGGGQETAGSTAEFRSLLGVFPPAPGRFQEWAGILKLHPHLAPAVEPGFRFVADGISVVVDASRPAQLRTLGNAVVPLQAAVALAVLLERAGIVIS